MLGTGAQGPGLLTVSGKVDAPESHALPSIDEGLAQLAFVRRPGYSDLRALPCAMTQPSDGDRPLVCDFDVAEYVATMSDDQKFGDFDLMTLRLPALGDYEIWEVVKAVWVKTLNHTVRVED